MLFSFLKYNNVYNKNIDTHFRQRPVLCLSRNCTFIKSSALFRKLFFRTLLMYINSSYCNFFYTPDQNFFYFTAFMHATYTRVHPSFYFNFIIKI